jgi:hypothetical protein
MRVKPSRPVVYFAPGGQRYDLKPGYWSDVPDSDAQQLLAKAGAYLHIRQDEYEPLIDPALAAPPIQPGSVIAWFVDRKFTGGIRQGDAGLVIRVTFDGNDWWFFTAGGWQIHGDQVFLVWAIARDGKVSEPYRVRDVGLDGGGYRYYTSCSLLAQAGVQVEAVDARFSEPLDPKPITDEQCGVPSPARPLLPTLSTEHQGEIQNACRCSDAEWSALLSGQPMPLRPPEPHRHTKSRREKQVSVTVDGAQGPVTVLAWVRRFFAVHASLVVCGHSLTHLPSGKCVRSGFPRRDDAWALAEQLLRLTDWSQEVIPAEALPRIRQCVTGVPMAPLTRRRTPKRRKEG